MVDDIAQASFDEHREVLDASARVLPALVQKVGALAWEHVNQGGKILICGNGGSAADSQHFAAELVARFKHERSAIAALALTTDTSALTALANDYGFEHVFARQVSAFGRSGDLLFALSTSGNSANVLAAVAVARKLGMLVIGFTGEGGGKLAAQCDHVIAVPSKVVARIQEVHELCLHSIAEIIEASAVAKTR